MSKKVFLLFLFFSLSLFSKDINIKVIDKDLDIPLEGVKIILTNGGYSGFTDSNGELILKIDDNIRETLVIATLTGYQSKKMFVSDFSNPILIKMSIEGIIEGKELVVEEKQYKKSDEIGKSKVIEKEELKSSSMIGQIEDVISTIKILPGVSYAGKFNSVFSVRGGNPDDFIAIYEGFNLEYPYHWGRGYSIFNPNAVDSMKFWTGIFPANLGPSSCSILEVNYLNPEDKFKFYYNSATSTQELFFNIPVGLKNAGILLGARLTYFDLTFLMMKDYFTQMGMEYSRVPYIYDVYLKWYWQVNPKFKWTLNGFFSSDGIGLKQIQDKITDSYGNVIEKRDIINTSDFKWYNYDAFVFSNFKILPTEKFFIETIIGYEFLTTKADGVFYDKGKKGYSTDFKNFMFYLNSLPDGDPQKEFFRTFLDTYNSQSDKNSYYIDTEGSFLSINNEHIVQTKLNFENQLTEKINFQYGLGATINFFNYEEKYKAWQPIFNETKNIFELKLIDWLVNPEDKKKLNYYTYLNFNFNIIQDVLKIETGLRFEHLWLFIDSDYSLTTYPTFSPRFNLTYTPVRNLKYLESFSISAGVALFSSALPETDRFKKEWNIKNFEVQIPYTLTSVIGFEFKFPLDIVFKIETYYKYFFNRLYLNTKGDGKEVFVHTDGIGHATGFDLLLERKISRYLDGIITYSFIFARYYNPSSDDQKETLWGEPTGIWYYPYYHRWHSLNIVLNIRPTSWLTITPSFTFASGAPLKKFSEAKEFYAIMKDKNNNDQVVPLYSQNTEYDDDLRADFSIPFNLKISFNYYSNKFKTEIYIACEDIFAMLYSPKAGKKTDIYTGTQIDAPEQRINTPLPSVGVKISF